MKIRNGFVSNSSSSSFVVPIDEITQEQRNAILNFVDYYKENIRPTLNKDESGYWYQSDEDLKKWVEGFWIIIEEDGLIKGHTSIDNFDIDMFFRFIGLSYHEFEEEY